MVYSAIETTCFGLYLPTSGFYNIKEESINAVKTVRECRLRDLYINPLITLFLAQELFVNMEKFTNREKSTRRCGDNPTRSDDGYWRIQTNQEISDILKGRNTIGFIKNKD